MGTFTFSLADTGSLVDRSLSANTPDDQLTYTGDDSIVWDRVNSERLRRGLPSLTTLGFPRPPEETADTSTAGSSQTFIVKGPPTLTEAQAREIFEQQRKAGSLVGLRPGDVINSAKQAEAGVPGALGQVSQTLAGIAGGPQGALSGALNQARNAASGLPAGLDIDNVTSVARQAAGTINSAIQNLSVTDGINMADFAKTAPGLVPIKSLSTVDVTAVLGQSKKLVGQAADVITNAKGVGQFGFDAEQLERAGVVKPGTASAYLSSGANDLTDVLKSPAVYTGKNGITDLNKLLTSVPSQTKIQQELMSSGLSELAANGIPVDNLNPTALAGTAMNAAKSVTGTLDWASGKQLPAGAKALYDQTSRDGAFAVNFANLNVDDAMKQEVPGIPAQDTVNRQTLDAAASRVVGNDKVPTTSYSNAVPSVSAAEIEEAFNQAADTFGAIADKFKSISQPLVNTTDPDLIVDGIAEISYLIGDLEVLDSTMQGLIRRAEALEPPDTALAARIEKAKTFVIRLIKAYEGAIDGLKRRGVDLVNR